MLEYVGYHSMTYGLSLWIPLHGVGSVSTDPYVFRSGMGANFTLAVDYYSPGSTVWGPATQLLNQYRQIRPCFSGDFYPLTPYSIDTTSTIAWQFDRPDLGQGLIQVFRRPDCTRWSATYKPQGLNPTATYQVTNPDVPGWSLTQTGSDLMTYGVTVSIGYRPGSAILTYTRIY